MAQEPPAVRGQAAVRYWPLVASGGIATAGDADVEVGVFSIWPSE